MSYSFFGGRIRTIKFVHLGATGFEGGGALAEGLAATAPATKQHSVRNFSTKTRAMWGPNLCASSLLLCYGSQGVIQRAASFELYQGIKISNKIRDM